jgi:hypothetical protein
MVTIQSSERIRMKGFGSKTEPRLLTELLDARVKSLPPENDNGMGFRSILGCELGILDGAVALAVPTHPRICEHAVRRLLIPILHRLENRRHAPEAFA